MRILTKILLLLVFCCVFNLQNTLAALPTAERLPASLEAPLSDLSSTPDGVYTITHGDFKNKLLATWSGSTLTFIDLEIWSTFSTQPDSFPSEVVDVKLLGDGITLVVALSSGDLAILDLSDTSTFENTIDSSTLEDDATDAESDSRLIDSSSDMDFPGLSAIAVDSNPDVNTVYMIDEDNEMYYEIDLDSNNLKSLTLGTSSDSEAETTFTPTDIAFASADSGDTILITTTDGSILYGSPQDFDFSEEVLEVRSEDESNPNLSSITITPDENFAYVIDSDNDLIWVFNIDSKSFIDQISGDTSLDPIEFDSSDENTSLTSLAFLSDSENSTVHGFVSGDLGVSIIEATDPTVKADSKIIDTDDSTANTFDPITLSATPSLITSLSDETLTILSANGDATLSVISDNPFVSVEGASVSTLTEADSIFTLTFQTDEAGTYTVYANSDPLQESGFELIAETDVADVDTDIVTVEMDINDFDRESFVEGDNKFYVFVTDAEGNLGWDAAVVTVDRPPEAIDITSATFGDQKIFVNFEASADSDIADYTLFAEPAADQDNPTCPGALTFETNGTIESTIETSSCTDNSCSGQITNLANSIAYCIAVRATDESDQEGPINGFNLSVTPEATVGPAEFLGEAGCSLQKQTQNSFPNIAIFAFTFFALGVYRFRFCKRHVQILALSGLLFLGLTLVSSTSKALERTPQNWTYELRGTYWIPTRSEVKGFFDDCCNLLVENEFGWLPIQQINITAGAGFGYRSNNAVGIDSGTDSGDTFKMWIIPMHLDVIYRFDYKEDQLIQPFVRVGADSFLFREYGAGEAILGNKLGAHAGLGFGILLDKIEGLTQDLEAEFGVNDVYLTLEGRYATINSFSQTGMDFSGFYTSIGLLFEF